MTDWSYIIMLSLLISHELDAVNRHEWRVLPLISALPERLGEQVFIWAHIPIFALVFGFGGLDPMSRIALGLSAFAIAHLLLHVVFRNHANYEFKTRGSWALIVGTGISGVLHLIAVANST